MSERVLFPPEAGLDGQADVRVSLDQLTEGRSVVEAARLRDVVGWGLRQYAFPEFRVVLGSTTTLAVRPLGDELLETFKRAAASGFLPRREDALAEEPERIPIGQVPPRGLPMVVQLSANQTEFLADLALRCTAVATGGVKVTESDVLSWMVEASKGILAEQQRFLGGSLSAQQAYHTLRLWARLVDHAAPGNESADGWTPDDVARS